MAAILIILGFLLIIAPMIVLYKKYEPMAQKELAQTNNFDDISRVHDKYQDIISRCFVFSWIGLIFLFIGIGLAILKQAPI